MRLGSILFPDSVVCVFKKAMLHEHAYTLYTHTFGILAADIVAAVDNGDDDDDESDGDTSSTHSLISIMGQCLVRSYADSYDPNSQSFVCVCLPSIFN